jgi:1-deoxy-D-xylulose-5-phosphate synthase
MALSTFSVPRGFLGVPAQDSHFASAVELHVNKLLQARPINLKVSFLCQLYAS